MKTSTSTWHREPIWWLALALPALTVPAGLATYALAAAGDNSAVIETVTRTGQMQVSDLDADLQAARASLRAQAHIDWSGHRLRVNLMGADARQLHLRLAHPTLAARDVDLWLDATQAGQFDTSFAPIEAHDWNVVLEAPDASWRLVGRIERGADSFQLAPAVSGP